MKSENRTMAVLTHVLGLIAGFLGPLIILLVTKDEYVKKHARNALNWQLSELIYSVVSIVLMLILVGFLLIVVVSVVNIIFCIIAAVKAGNGETWKYPLSIPFLK